MSYQARLCELAWDAKCARQAKGDKAPDYLAALNRLVDFIEDERRRQVVLQNRVRKLPVPLVTEDERS